MAQSPNQDLTEHFIEFYRTHYEEEITHLAQHYPDEERSLYIDFDDLYSYDPDVAEDYRDKPEQMQEYAEEALRLYELPADISLGQANIRITNIPDTIAIRSIRADSNQLGKLVAVEGIVREATDVQPKVTEAAFECQRCGTMTYIPQTGDEIEEPHKCQGCEREGPFRMNIDQSVFVDHQTVRLLEDPEILVNGVMPEDIEIRFEDDIAGEATPGDKVRVNGALHLEQDDNTFTHYLDGISVETLERKQSDLKQSNPTLVDDLETYTELAATALSTLPENALEEETKAKLITPFVEALGWNKYDSTEVRLEYTDPKTSLLPDYALFGPDSDIPDVIIEAKKLGKNLEEEEDQLYDYMRVFSAEWGVLTNGEEFYVYRRSGDNYLPEKLAEMRAKNLTDASIIDSLRRSAFYE